MQITGSMSDPVPTCSVSIRDNASAINIVAPQEILVLDDQVYPNPTVNELLNPIMNPYNTNWVAGSNTGITLSQNGGGGLVATISNMSVGTATLLTQNSTVIPWYPTAGQSYIFSCYVQGSGVINQVQARIALTWFDLAGNTISSAGFTSVLSTSLTRYGITSIAPSNVGYVQVQLTAETASGTNSAVIAFTEAQLEPVWFPTLAYPTPWCGPSQTNCQQLPNGVYIRQYRKFAGFVNHIVPGDYHGNVRTIQVNAVGYAWLAGTIYGNDTFATTADGTIITTLLSKYFLSSGVALCTTTNIASSVTLTNFQLNWDTMRTAFDNLCAQSTFYWTIDFYWNFVYAPPGYFSTAVSLICDNSSIPDMVNTFSAYAFSSESDYTQPGSSIIVLGNGANTAKVIDPSRTAQLGFTSGYFLPVGNSWMRKINDSTLASVADCTQRGMAELIQYDYARGLYHLTTNVELIAGYGVRVTSATENLYQTTLLLQQVSASWIGTSETLTDEWEYQADLGATNRVATHMISRIFRLATANSAATAINTTTLAVLENMDMTDYVNNNSLYATNTLVDRPVGYYRLGEPTGFGITLAYDWSGNAYNGTITGTVTLGETGALYNDPNTSMLFDGSTGEITLVPALNTSGWSVLTLEAWINFSTVGFATNPRIFSNDNTAADNKGCELYVQAHGAGLVFNVGQSTGFSTLSAAYAFTTGTWYYVAATWFASGSIALYVNPVGGTALATGSTVAGTIAAATNNMAIGYAPATNSNFFPGLVDEAGIYQAALGGTRVQSHLNYGKYNHA